MQFIRKYIAGKKKKKALYQGKVTKGESIVRKGTHTSSISFFCDAFESDLQAM